MVSRAHTLSLPSWSSNPAAGERGTLKIKKKREKKKPNQRIHNYKLQWVQKEMNNIKKQGVGSCRGPSEQASHSPWGGVGFTGSIFASSTLYILSLMRQL